MNLLGATLVVIIFAVLVHVVGLLRRTMEVVALSKDSVSVFRNPGLDDEAKEKALQKHAVRLFVLLVLLILGSAVALLAPVGMIWLLGMAGMFSVDGVLDMLQRWDFLIAATVIGVGIYPILRRLVS